MAYLKVHPKVYWIWTHRKWLLENVPLGPGESEDWRNGFWKTELMVVEKILDADARNCKLRYDSNPSSCMELQAICHRLASRQL